VAAPGHATAARAGERGAVYRGGLLPLCLPGCVSPVGARLRCLFVCLAVPCVRPSALPLCLPGCPCGCPSALPLCLAVPCGCPSALPLSLAVPCGSLWVPVCAGCFSVHLSVHLAGLFVCLSASMLP
jgi:hypothetical protein